jgi:hypothetical protein
MNRSQPAGSVLFVSVGISAIPSCPGQFIINNWPQGPSTRVIKTHPEASRESSPQGFKLDNCDCSAKEEQNRRPSGGFNHDLRS